MDAFVKSEIYENEAYLTTTRDEIFHFWFDGEPYPIMEKLTESGVAELNVLRRKYPPAHG